MARRRRRRSAGVLGEERARRVRKPSTAARVADAVLSYAERKPREFAELVAAALDGRLRRAIVAAASDPRVQEEVVRRAAQAARRSM